MSTKARKRVNAAMRERTRKPTRHEQIEAFKERCGLTPLTPERRRELVEQLEAMGVFGEEEVCDDEDQPPCIAASTP